MPRRDRPEEIKANDLRGEPRFAPYPPFADAWERHLADPDASERRRVPVTAIGIPPGYAANAADVAAVCPDAAAFAALRRSREEAMAGLPVLERQDGSLWAYGDAGTIGLYYRYAPDATVVATVIGTDPEPPKNRKKGVTTGRP